MPCSKLPDKQTVGLQVVCDRAGISREHAELLFIEIMEACLADELVNVPRIGRWWMQYVPPREIQIPTKAGRSELRTVVTRPTYRLRFRPTWGFREYMRLRCAGRAQGTGAQPAT